MEEPVVVRNANVLETKFMLAVVNRRVRDMHDLLSQVLEMHLARNVIVQYGDLAEQYMHVVEFCDRLWGYASCPDSRQAVNTLTDLVKSDNGVSQGITLLAKFHRQQAAIKEQQRKLVAAVPALVA